MIDAIVAGHLCVDIIPTISQEALASGSFMAPGRLTETGAMVVSTGGAVSNTGIGLHRLGVDVRLLARIGDDTIGQLTRDIVAQQHPRLAEHLVSAQGEPSSYTIVISPPHTDRTFLHCPGTNDTFGPEDVPDDLLAGARLFHFGYPPLMRRMYADGGMALAEIMQHAKSHGLTTCLDMAMPDPSRPSGQADWAGICAQALPHVDIFLPSVEELLYMLQRERYEELARRVGPADMLDAITVQDIQQLARRALGLGAKVVVLKLGHRGLYLRSAERLINLGRGFAGKLAVWARRELWTPCFEAQVVTTLGAGDATIAGFLAALLVGQPPDQAIISATAVGACNVEAADATSGVRTWADTQRRIENGWPKLATDKRPSQNWRWDARGQLWRGPDDAATSPT